MGVKDMVDISAQAKNTRKTEEQIISSSITQSWTEQALECYSIGCDCSKCSLRNGRYSFKCQMPKVIDILISIIGKPRINLA